MKRIEQTAPDEQLLHRIRSEFLEMPGLRLSPEQAQRLWTLDAQMCTRILERLVDARFLQRGSDGRYGRISDVRIGYVPGRMVKADVRAETPQRKRA